MVERYGYVSEPGCAPWRAFTVNRIGSSAFSKMYGWSQSAPNQAPERRNHRLADENKTRVKSASGIYPIYKQVFTPCDLNSKSEIGLVFVYSEAGLIPVNLRQV